jgi:hypothetical protein
MNNLSHFSRLVKFGFVVVGFVTKIDKIPKICEKKIFVVLIQTKWIFKVS